jgi:sphingolipid 4-desaturase/C4-monooxygenase
MILAQHPEIAQLFGYEPRTKWRMAGVALLQLAIAGAFSLLGASAPWWITAPILALTAWIFGAVLSHYGGVVIHEASHNLCARTERANRWIAILANLPKILPYAMTFRRHHLTHHRHMGVIGIDNDLPPELERRAIGNGPVRKLFWLLAYPLFGGLFRGWVARPDRWELVQLAVQIPFSVLSWLVLGPWGFAYLAVSAFASASLHPIAAHFIHEHYLWDEGQETYSYYGPLNAATENLGYHVEHHDFVNVPGSRLPELHAIAREFYAPLVSHTSWTRILWTFVTESRFSHHSRFVRPDRDGDGGAPRTCRVEPVRHSAGL